MPKITPFLWFDHQAEAAAEFSLSVFSAFGSKIHTVVRYDAAAAKASGRPVGSAMTVAFQLAGQEFTALNGGPAFQFSPAISFVVNCQSQAEVDDLWGKLSADPTAEQCGWLKDKFGLSWQIVPTVLSQLLGDKDAAKAGRVMQAMLQMKKIDIAALEQAAAGK